MKTFLKIIAVFVLLILVAVAAVMLMTSGMSRVADKFLSASGSGDYEQAYSLLSEDFKQNVSRDQLKSYMEEIGFSAYDKASWTSRSVSGGRGELHGSITTVSGGVLPVSLDFVKGDSGWKIFAIQKPAAGIKEETPAGQLPSEDKQVQMVRDSMQAFAESIRNKSMATLYNHSSNLFRSQYTLEKFDEAFNVFFPYGEAFMVLDEHTPRFSEPAVINENGVLQIKGHYATEPEQVHFEQGFIIEGLSWKLLSINVITK